MSDPFGNPKDRFSYVAAQMIQKSNVHSMLFVICYEVKLTCILNLPEIFFYVLVTSQNLLQTFYDYNSLSLVVLRSNFSQYYASSGSVMVNAPNWGERSLVGARAS